MTNKIIGTNQKTGNKRLSAVYQEKGHQFVNAAAIMDAFMAQSDRIPRLFTRQRVIEILKLKQSREHSLLSDAFAMLKAKGLVEFDKKRNIWENKTKS